MPRDFIDKEDNYNEKDYRVVMGKFSSSLRGKAIILFLVYFVILALYFLINIYVYFPHVSNNYESVVSKNHVRRVLENLNYKLNTRMVINLKNTKNNSYSTFIFFLDSLFLSHFFFCFDLFMIIAYTRRHSQAKLSTQSWGPT